VYPPLLLLQRNNGVSTLILAVIVAHLHPFLSHPNSQNKGRSTLHVALKFPSKRVATLHPWNKPIKGGYTIKTLNGVPYFLPGLMMNEKSITMK